MKIQAWKQVHFKITLSLDYQSKSHDSGFEIFKAKPYKVAYVESNDEVNLFPTVLLSL